MPLPLLGALGAVLLSMLTVSAPSTASSAGDGDAGISLLDCLVPSEIVTPTSARLSRDAAEAGVAERYVERAYARELRRRQTSGARTVAAAARASAPVNVPVHVHVISRSDGAGAVTDARIADQIDVLNQAFSASGFVFRLIGTDRTVNNAWYAMDIQSDAETQAKLQLHEGGRRALNVYLTGTPTYLGWATFPSELSFRPRMDGVVLLNASLPGNPGPYGAGDTATHEVGHWLGLFHTFEGGSCSGPGDFVADTAQERVEHYECTASDSCPTKPGADPIHNFMDYTDDACMDHFTPGQGDRMHDQTATYRNTVPVASAATVAADPGRSALVVLRGTDADTDTLGYTIVDPPDHGALAGAGTSRTYAPGSTYRGADSFAFTVTDVFGRTSAPATIAIRDDAVRATVSAGARQRLRALGVAVTCREGSCGATARGSVVARKGGRVWRARLAPRSATLGLGVTKALRPSLTLSQRRALLTRLRHGWRATAVIRTRLGDVSGNATTVVKTIRVVR